MKDRKDQLLAQLWTDTDLTQQDKAELHAYITQLESLIEDYRRYAIAVCSPTKPQDLDQHRSLMHRTHTLIGGLPEI